MNHYYEMLKLWILYVTFLTHFDTVDSSTICYTTSGTKYCTYDCCYDLWGYSYCCYYSDTITTTKTTTEPYYSGSGSGSNYNSKAKDMGYVAFVVVPIILGLIVDIVTLVIIRGGIKSSDKITPITVASATVANQVEQTETQVWQTGVPVAGSIPVVNPVPNGNQYLPTGPNLSMYAPPQQPVGHQYQTYQQPVGLQYPTHQQPVGNQYPTHQQPVGNQYPTHQQPVGNQYPTHQQPVGHQHPTYIKLPEYPPSYVFSNVPLTTQGTQTL
ncbi:hypothetical protein Bpfe_021998 [Biomphalaria pfeifferi]|uniref:Uncharacterized protein n=1 Tax=Biomphalaria pfeifferi TaxID=112525 RepID=A0AAD8B8A8_BIOPF|nr:hypothetical protein Bpfe_021998 [Biomphalaria pfeifferi]